MQRVREIAMGLPQVVERPSHGEASWFIGGRRNFVTMSDHHHDDRVSVCFAADMGVQQLLVDRDPARYYRPPYVGGRGWVGAYLDGSGVAAPDWDEITQLITDAWLLVAPPRIRSELN
jgi:hypothetical protein